MAREHGQIDLDAVIERRLKRQRDAFARELTIVEQAYQRDIDRLVTENIELWREVARLADPPRRLGVLLNLFGVRRG